MIPLATGTSFKTVTMMAHVLNAVKEGKRVVVCCATKEAAAHLKKYFPGGYETKVSGEGPLTGMLASIVEGDPE